MQLEKIIKDAVCQDADTWYNQNATGDYFQHREIGIRQITARMLEIEVINMKYNKETNFGQKPNGKENEIESLLTEWDELKLIRNKIKNR